MDVDEFDYESLPTTSLSINMMAGATAGVLEHCVMYPLDSVKTRMQSFSPTTANLHTTITTTFRNMIKGEGLLRPVRGISAVVAGAGPAHALYFGSYEMTKELLTKFTQNNHVNYMASGVVATLIHDAVSNPTEVIKQRMQMYNSSYRSVIGCMMGVYRNEGMAAFYRSYTTQLVMNIPHQTIHFAVYEFFQNMLNHERKYNPPVHMVAGGAAGAAASAMTTPLDVVKTLLNTQEIGFIKGMPEAIRQIYSMAGIGGFFRGMTARVLYSMPATAICWSTYEFLKFYLCGASHDTYKSSITGKNTLQPRSTSNLLPVSVVADEALLQGQSNKANVTYVLPVSSDPDDLGSLDKSPASSSTITPTPTATVPSASATSASNATTSPSSPSTAIPATSGAIKSVCELSSSVTGPTLNLHTRHTDVKSPFDRRYSGS